MAEAQPLKSANRGHVPLGQNIQEILDTMSWLSRSLLASPECRPPVYIQHDPTIPASDFCMPSIPRLSAS